MCTRPGVEALRVKWGCDAPLVTPDGKPGCVFATSCPVCMGGGCDECGQSGELRRSRCPSVEASGIERFTTAYSFLDRFRVLPAAGGMLDQHPQFVAAVRLMESERATIEHERQRALDKSNKSPKGPGRGGRNRR